MNKRLKAAIVLAILLSMLLCSSAFAEDADDLPVSDDNLILVDEKITISLAGDVSY